jgi:hypothetical protein
VRREGRGKGETEEKSEMETTKIFKGALSRKYFYILILNRREYLSYL